MFGILRLVLAALVAVSHCGVLVAGLNPGVTAVVIFYLLAGYVMSDQIKRYFPGRGDTLAFYRDRLLRIFPLYLLFMSGALLFVWLTGYAQGYMSKPLTPSTLLQNLLVVPLNFFMFTGNNETVLIPPAWSLGAELQFYLLAPLLLRSQRWFWPGFVCSGLVFLFAATGQLNTDVWGYRLLPGVLFMFLLGAALQRRDLRFVAVATAIATLAAVLAAVLGNWQAPFLREELLGLLLGVTAIVLLGRLPVHRWDVRLGYLAYGVFLVHFLAIWWFELHPFAPTGSPAHVAAVLAVAVVLAFVGFWLADRPIAQWRRRHRHGRPLVRMP